jgi:hypothetical protein
MALCVGAVLGPIAGFIALPFAILGAACALMSLVLACVEVQETAATQRSPASHRDAA